MAACPRNSLTERQMETLRAEVGASTVCGSSYFEPRSPSRPPSPSAGDDGDNKVVVLAAVAVYGVVGFSLIGLAGYCKRARRQGNAAAVRVPAVPQPQQMQMGAVPVCQGTVVQGYPVPVQ
eukprot:scaffold19226_cov75-Phaeocystis_antarctica.AAC.2